VRARLSLPTLRAMKKKTSASGMPPVVVVPPPPTTELPGAVALVDQQARNLAPLTEHEHPNARGTRLKADRTEVRHEVHRVAAPRESLRPAERASQPRSHKPKR